MNDSDPWETILDSFEGLHALSLGKTSNYLNKLYKKEIDTSNTLLI